MAIHTQCESEGGTDLVTEALLHLISPYFHMFVYAEFSLRSWANIDSIVFQGLD